MLKLTLLLRSCVVLWVAETGGLFAAEEFAGKPSIEISSDRLTVTILRQGASLASITLRGDPADSNPLWLPEQRQNGGFGHFVCLDGFGATSPEEAKAGLSFHGEALRTVFDVVGPVQVNGGVSVTLTATLPLAQERFIRSYEVRSGENVVYVRSRLESLVAFDRPISWAEHATIGSPFLERNVTVVDQSGSRSRTRPYEAAQKGARSFASGQDFQWPNAPLRGESLGQEKTRELSAAPATGASMDHSTTALDMASTWSWVTAVNPKTRRIVGWVWRTADFPWLQDWQNYPETGVLARGLEFSTQPWDIPRREAVALNPLMGNPTFRWLPARSAIETQFALFYAETPAAGLPRVHSVEVTPSEIVVNGSLRLPASVTATK
ncbi:MAG: hypothetical protein H7039_08920 [Bryobacteraceae bacterium]|nr:hypothetical protein [Bryobacteraceae bacterium]